MDATEPHDQSAEASDQPWYTGLTDKQRRFVEEYCIDFNGSAAARRAGYAETSAAEQAYENLRKPQIRSAVEAYLDAQSMSAAEAVQLLSRWGRGTVAPFLVGGEINLSLPGAQDNLHLLREVSQTKTTHASETGYTETVNTKIKLHDPLAAVTKILEVHGRIIKRSDLTSAGKPISNVMFYMPDNGRGTVEPSDE